MIIDYHCCNDKCNRMNVIIAGIEIPPRRPPPPERAACTLVYVSRLYRDGAELPGKDALKNDLF